MNLNRNTTTNHLAKLDHMAAWDLGWEYAHRASWDWEGEVWNTDKIDQVYCEVLYDHHVFDLPTCDAIWEGIEAYATLNP